MLSRDLLCPEVPVSVSSSGLVLPMRCSLLWCAARLLWPRGAVAAARRPLSGGSRPLEELFSQGGPLRTFLERQAGSEAHLKVRRPELVAVVKLLNEKEQELRETEHLLHGKGRARDAASEHTLDPSLAFSTKPLPTLPKFEILYSLAAVFGLDQKSRHHDVRSDPILS
ncbi:hypothetical protein P7K49_008809, partial [Saguinus oedipus]